MCARTESERVINMDERSIEFYRLKNKNGMEAVVSNYGATLVSLFVPDENGDKTDVVLGYDDVEGYERGGCVFGATVGRNANRISGARFSLNGKQYELQANEGTNNLHSGPDYYHKRVWTVDRASETEAAFSLHSPDMDQGYPGELLVRVIYELDDENGLHIRYKALAEQDTIVNLTNHSYFNLNGHDSGSVLGHRLWLASRLYTLVDEGLIPTGELRSVEGTRMDFQTPRAIGSDYDDNFVLTNRRTMEKVAQLTGDHSGITMSVYTDLPAVQVYTANALTCERGKGKAVYGKNAGVCLETQFIPDSVHMDGVETPVVRSRETFRTETVFRFTRTAKESTT